MHQVIERPIDDGEVAIYLPTEHDLPLQEIFRFYRDLEKHLRKQENFGSAFALRLTEYKAGSSEGRFQPKIRSQGRKGVRARQLEREDELMRKAERQAIAAERQADAADRGAKAAEDGARWSRKAYLAALAAAVATAIGVAVSSGEVLLPQSDDPTAPPVCEIVLSTTEKQQTLLVPAPKLMPPTPIKPTSAGSSEYAVAQKNLAHKEQTTIYVAAGEGRTIRITGTINPDASIIVTDFGNTIPLISSHLPPNVYQGRHVFEVHLGREKNAGELQGQLIRAQRLDHF